MRLVEVVAVVDVVVEADSEAIANIAAAAGLTATLRPTRALHT